jgi:hypothetical protein
VAKKQEGDSGFMASGNCCHMLKLFPLTLACQFLQPDQAIGDSAITPVENGFPPL